MGEAMVRPADRRCEVRPAWDEPAGVQEAEAAANGRPDPTGGPIDPADLARWRFCRWLLGQGRIGDWP